MLKLLFYLGSFVFLVSSAQSINVTGRTWNGRGGDVYHSYHVPESVGQLAPGNGNTLEYPIHSSDSVAVGGGLALLVTIPDFGEIYRIEVINITNKNRQGNRYNTGLFDYRCSPARPILDISNMRGYVSINCYSTVSIFAVNLRDGSLLWKNKTEGHGCGGLLWYPELNRLVFATNFKPDELDDYVYVNGLDLSNGNEAFPQITVSNSTVRCPRMVAFSPTETLILVQADDPIQGPAIMINSSTGKTLWTNASGYAYHAVSPQPPLVAKESGIVLLQSKEYTWKTRYWKVQDNKGVVEAYAPTPSTMSQQCCQPEASVVGTDGHVFWRINHQDKTLGEYFAENGTSTGIHYHNISGFWGFAATSDYLFALVTNEDQKKFSIQSWRRGDPELGSWRAKLNSYARCSEFGAPSTPHKELIYQGGWLFVQTKCFLVGYIVSAALT